MNQRPASRIVTVVTFLAILLAASSLVYGAVWWVDQGGIRSPLALVLSAEAADRMGSFAEVVVAVLGVAITVVAILVELAANRYTPRITDLFVRDPVNVVVLAFFVVSSVLVVWLDVTGWPPEATTMRLAALVLISASLLALSLSYHLGTFRRPLRHGRLPQHWLLVMRLFGSPPISYPLQPLL